MGHRLVPAEHKGEARGACRSVWVQLGTERADLCPAVGTVPQRSPFFRSLQALADYASENLEAMNPPLFLRFLNLLMNDAIFLLDEAIQVGLSTHAVDIA